MSEYDSSKDEDEPQPKHRKIETALDIRLGPEEAQKN